MGATILQDMVVVMVIAAAVTILFYRLRQPVVLGYLLAGAIVGPHTMGLVHDIASINGLAELGIIFLMFAVGLEFDLRKLRKVGAKATVTAAVQIGIMIWLGYEAGRFLGWSPMDSIFLGAIISISSTVIIVKVLSEMGRLKEEYAELALGVLIIEDVAAIVMVALLSALGATGHVDAAVVGNTIGGILIFVFIFLAVGLVLVPRLIDVVSKFHVEEVLVITVVGLAFGAALLAVKLGFSIALGAFLMGAIIAESKAVRRVEHKIVPIRDLFTAMFFVAVGMLINPADLARYAGPIVLITIVTIVGKTLGVTLGAFIAGYDGRTAAKTGTAMGQIGEFSFIIASLGLTLGVIRPELHPIAVAVSAVTALTTPLFIRGGTVAVDRLAPRLPMWYTRPLVAYTRGVRRWSARNIDTMPSDKRRARHGTRVAIYAAWLFGLLIVAAYISDWAGAEVGSVLSLGSNATRAAAIGFLGLIGLPIFAAFIKATEAYALHAAKASSMDPKTLTKRDAAHRRPKVVAAAAATLASILLLGLAIRVAWGVHPLALPNTWLLVPILMTIGFVGFFAWPKLEKLYRSMEQTLNDLMGDDEGLPIADDEHKRLRERLPWGMDVEEVHIHARDRAAYRSLKSLNLRDRTGATVLSIERGQSIVPNPHPDLVILPHDRVILVGKHEQLEGARRFLSTRVEREAPVVMSELHVPPTSPAVGLTLGSLHLGDRGATLGVIQRQDGSLVAPHERVQLQADDHVYVYGNDASVKDAASRLRAHQFPRAPQPKRGPSR